jgi:hypothetical protein
MFSKNHLVVPAVVILSSFLGVSAAKAQTATQRCYTLASLQANYAIVVTYGANVAVALATRSYDGNGNLTGTFVLNQPSTGSTGARTIVTGTQAGTYTVNCNGTGKFNRLVTASTGLTALQVDDFVITGSFVQDGVLIATSIADATEVPSAIVAGGILVTRVQTRLPDFH